MFLFEAIWKIAARSYINILLIQMAIFVLATGKRKFKKFLKRKLYGASGKEKES